MYLSICVSLYVSLFGAVPAEGPLYVARVVAKFVRHVISQYELAQRTIGF